MVGRLVTVRLAERPVVRGRPGAVADARGRWRRQRHGLHHAERGVRADVIVDGLATRAPGGGRFVSALPQRGRRVLDLPVRLVTGLSHFGRRVAVVAGTPGRVPRVVPVLFPVNNTVWHAINTGRIS